MALLYDVIEIELSIIILILFNYPSKSLFFQAQAEEAEATDAHNEATMKPNYTVTVMIIILM